ncbi:carbon-nitrogen hydrolase family protein [Rhodococcus fascians]|nr:carbon-nitrogen hydrolase family protein [Rhodococcus fascians]
MDNFPRFTAAAVQAAPVFLDKDATARKVASLIHEAAANGASLIAFPEVFVSGFPYWAWTMNPVESGKWFERFYRASIDIPGPQLDTIRAAAAATHTTVVVGVNERGRHSLGVIYNSMVTIGPDGAVLGIHRKLVPTWAEKLVYTGGDGSTLRVHDTEVGPLGVLACGENTNTLARFTLLSQGELVHVSSYISSPVVPADYDMADAIAIRTAAHCFEGKLFSVVSCSTISDEIVDTVAGDDEEIRSRFRRERSSLSGIFGPDGRPVTEPLVDAEGIVYGEIDLSKCIAPKQMQDIIGNYNRFDVFSLRVDAKAQQPVEFVNVDHSAQPSIGPWVPDDDLRVSSGLMPPTF